jgi:hypothetical protein
VVPALRTGKPVAEAVAAIASGTGRFLAVAAEAAAVAAAVPSAAPAVVEEQRAPAVRAARRAPVVLVAVVAAGAGKRR